jgi:hypothetical protein
MRLIEHLVQSLRDSTIFNPEAQAPPACVLWPDGDRQWESVISRLQTEMPELFQLGAYLPGKRIGPAIWLRCVIAKAIETVPIPARSIPILYLPGVSRQDLRAVESCSETLKPLAELQFRGVIWSQVNAKDWTVLAFLKSNQGGLGLDVAQDADSKQAMQLVLYRLLDEEVETLRGKHLNKDFFNTMLSGGDPIRDLLQWLDQGDSFRASRDDNQWRGFVEICKSQLGFDPENDGPLKAATLLANRKGNWDNVWGRFCEAPARYSHVPGLLRKSPLPSGLFDDKSAWPQWNETEEKNLRQMLLRTAQLPPHEARKLIIDAEEKHGTRRELVWAELGEAPLANALKSLATMAEVTKQSLAAGAPQDMAAAYQTIGWNADASVMEALASVQSLEDLAAIQAVVQTIYVPWIDEAARHLQSQVDASAYPSGLAVNQHRIETSSGECIVFVDGLRFDLAKSLEALLRKKGFTVDLESAWAALPSVTATAKPAVTPVRHLIRGQEVNADFEPSVAATGQSLKGGYHLRKLLTDNGWQILDRSETGDPIGCAWTEVGDVDHEGHERGAQLARHIGTILGDIRDRIVQLLAEGWKTVRVVTDHGWLLAPGGLPKTELPSALSDNTWGRCAAIKPGAVCSETLYHWYWSVDLSFALAPGVSCYRAGIEYTHGGLSLQECVVAYLNVTTQSSVGRTDSVEIQDVTWKGMRCKVAIEGFMSGLRLDIRTHAGNPSSAVTMSDRPFKEDGTASVVVEDENLTDHEATIVIIDAQGELVAQRATIIGKEET